MPRLITLSEFQPAGGLSPSFYFPDFYRDWYHRGMGEAPYRYTVTSGFPFAIHMHDTVLKLSKPDTEAGRLRVEIRRFIADHLSDDVILTYTDKSYFYLDRPRLREDGSRDWGHSPSHHEVRHGYDTFNFSEAKDAMVFKLRFSEHVSDIADRHPDYAWVGEDQVNRHYWD